MRNKLYIVFILIVNHSYTQTNLVYNGDFELYDTCPNNVSSPNDIQIEYCLGWTIATWGTSDYYNSCSNNISYQPVGVPNNFIGYQNPYSGNGYTGSLFYYISETTDGHYREYIQGTLVDSLQSGKKYSFSLRLSLANNSALSINEIGVVFTNSKIQQPSSWKPFYINPNIIFASPSFYKDTSNWVELTGSFIATGGENYLTIGNFNDTLISDTFHLVPFDTAAPDFSSYYYIDDVKLYLENDSNITPLFNQNCLPNVFTPNYDNLNDLLYTVNCGKVIKTIIYNRWGNKIIETNDENYFWNGKTQDDEECSEGTYYYIIETADKKFKGFVQLIR